MSNLEPMEVTIPQTEVPEEPAISAIVSTVRTAVDDNEIDRDEASERTEVAVDGKNSAEESEEVPLRESNTDETEAIAVCVRNTDIATETNENGTDVDRIDNSIVTDPQDDVDNGKSPSLVETQHSEGAQRFFYNWMSAPKLLCAAKEEYASAEGNENFTKGCQWSPDGTCLMVPADDFRIRIYELPRELYNGEVPDDPPLPDLKPALSVREGGLVYDSCWYPLMNSWDPATCCFLSTSRESPLHLWDAFTGELRATYRPYNQVDEVEAAISVQFVDGGREVWCGFKGALRSFDTDRPGRQKNTVSLKKEFPNVTGLVSCIRENPIMPGLIAFGTYSKCVGLYKDGPLCSFKTDSGVTQIEFSPCGTKMYTAVRRNNEFLCWDLRNPGVILFSMQNRFSNTNQRIQFAISTDGTEIVSGGTDGFVQIWKPSEASNEEEVNPLSRIRLSNDCVNGVNMHKSLPILATSSGQRICDDENDRKSRDNSVRLWYFQN